MRKTYITPLLLIVVILCIAGALTYYFFTIPNDRANSEASKNLASTDVEIYTDLEGNPVTFEAYEGKVRVVNSWASWTPFSVAELQDMESIAQEYTSQDLVFLAINRKEPKELAKQFLSTIQEFKKVVFIIDLTDAYYVSVGGFAMPETIVYDTKGAIVVHKRGSMTKEEMRMYVNQAVSASN